MVPIQVIEPGGGPSNFRFVINPTSNAKEFYVSYYPVGAPGPEGKGNLRHDSGIDIPIPQDVTLPPYTDVVIGLEVRVRGLSMFWNPASPQPVGMPSAFLIMPRSSITKPGVRSVMLTNGVGLVDQGYTGELKITVKNFSNEPLRLTRGTALVQLVAPLLQPAEYSRADPDTPMEARLFLGNQEGARGAGGLGSTGLAGSST